MAGLVKLRRGIGVVGGRRLWAVLDGPTFRAVSRHSRPPQTHPVVNSKAAFQGSRSTPYHVAPGAKISFAREADDQADIERSR
jgi:hypothetical protein